MDNLPSLNDREFYVFDWYDKVDKCYMSDMITFHRSPRSICRGYLQNFETNKKLNPKEFDLVVLGVFDDSTGTIKPFEKPFVLNPLMVYPESEE